MDAEQVTSLSTAAWRNGVRPGMRAGGVAAIAPDTIVLERNPDKERQALDAVAMALLQYTPEVAFTDDSSVLLDVSASLRLFGGPAEICRLIRASIAGVGFTAYLGAAPTGKGAWLLSRCDRMRGRLLCRRVLQMTSLTRRLDRLPCNLLPSAVLHNEWLRDIGARDLGALRRLPRPGLLRRTSKHLMKELDLAYGQAPELFEWIKVPLAFSERIETFDRIEHADALLLGARRLIIQMTGWLVSLQQAVKTFVLSLEHERGRTAIPPTLLEITLAEAAWREEHLVRLLKERLGKVELGAPVIALRLDAKQLEPMLPPNASLFPEPGGTTADFNRLVELLTARLGAENVLCPAPAQDYRPEFSNVWAPVSAGASGDDEDDDEVVDRPFWVLQKPIALLMRNDRPFYGSPLALIRGPERVEAGWWDDQTAARDYFVAQGTDASCYWIYLERTQEARWFLHGLYA